MGGCSARLHHFLWSPWVLGASAELLWEVRREDGRRETMGPRTREGQRNEHQASVGMPGILCVSRPVVGEAVARGTSSTTEGGASPKSELRLTTSLSGQRKSCFPTSSLPVSFLTRTLRLRWGHPVGPDAGQVELGHDPEEPGLRSGTRVLMPQTEPLPLPQHRPATHHAVALGIPGAQGDSSWDVSKLRWELG
jgi:hypothetical protein